MRSKRQKVQVRIPCNWPRKLSDMLNIDTLGYDPKDIEIHIYGSDEDDSPEIALIAYRDETDDEMAKRRKDRLEHIAWQRKAARERNKRYEKEREERDKLWQWKRSPEGKAEEENQKKEKEERMRNRKIEINEQTIERATREIAHAEERLKTLKGM